MRILRRDASLIGAGLLATLLMTTDALAGGPVMAGDYKIYYNAMSTETLDPEIAKLYQIKRDKRLGLLNVTVVKPQTDGPRQNVPARVEATAQMGSGPKTAIAMREIRVGSGVSYSGQFPIANRQTVKFEIQVTPPGGGEPAAIELEQQFFID
ncbi:hypothetical protein CKO25_01040 [Thiocapsa imhoffii]|uniref:DUF4426 domain-containing protein n=1 Tax=Thiocapsa imhoffii TaxID=382777 RepID=A0A9X0WEV4_9GAMM|nr:DUF4426 domain-containing protein [Thiocapsa imhoffii]MBK1643260.1 hypothetical protein [Thiocapsa imhoffii]